MLLEKNNSILKDSFFENNHLHAIRTTTKPLSYSGVTLQPEEIFAAGNGTMQFPYEIQTEEQLRLFACSLSDSVQYKDCYIQLTNDLNLSDREWIPIGGGQYPFRGHFDGGNYTISGLIIGNATIPHLDSPGQLATGYFGFFGVLEKNSFVGNLSLAVELYVTSSQSLYIGGLSGYASQALIENVHISGTVSGCSYHPNANIFIGGLCGNCYRQKIQYCSSQASLQAETMGGMAEVGGIVGFHNRGSISHCHVSGSLSGNSHITLNGRSVLGGIAGVQAGTINNCYATSPISSNHPNDYAGVIAGWATGISSTYDCFYPIAANPETTHLSANKPFGCTVNKGTNNFGNAYEGCMIYNILGFDSETIQQKLQDAKMKIVI